MSFFSQTIILVVSFLLLNLSSVHSLAPCKTDVDCSNGKCRNDSCKCIPGFVTHKGEQCSYQQRDKTTAFLLSFLIGTTGVDWFFLARGSTVYIIVGVIKLLTGIVGIKIPLSCWYLGVKQSNRVKNFLFRFVSLLFIVLAISSGVWWLADWIRILTGDFKDGNNVRLNDWPNCLL